MAIWSKKFSDLQELQGLLYLSIKQKKKKRKEMGKKQNVTMMGFEPTTIRFSVKGYSLS